MNNYFKTIGSVKICHNKQFLTLIWVFMANINVNNQPLVIHDPQGHFQRQIMEYQLQIVECYGHKAVEYGEKYCFILVSQIFLLTNILAHLVFWGLC